MALKKVFKKSGHFSVFDPLKIEGAILRSFKQAGEKKVDEAKSAARQAVLRLERKFEHAVPKAEDVKDVIEEVLLDYGLSSAADAFRSYSPKKSAKEKAANLQAMAVSNSQIVLEKRYLRKNEAGAAIETSKGLFSRVAKNVAEVELKYGKKKDQVKKLESDFFNLMSNFEFLPNSPALMNAGTDLQQLSACFVLPVEDSLGGIFDSVKNAAIIHQSGGGTGFNFSKLRPKGDAVKLTGGAASGPIPFMHVFDAATDAIKQGSRRRGANIAVLDFNHPDILEFVSAKEKGGLSNFNLSVSASDEFMKGAENGGDFKLINPRTQKSSGIMDSQVLFEAICKSAWNSGDPGMIFIDEINWRNSLKKIGKINCTNPCGEVELFDFESCNLGSINLAKMLRPVVKSGAKKSKVQKGKKNVPEALPEGPSFEFDFEKFEKIIPIAVRFLDNVIDATRFPLKESEEVSKQNRKIGLGVMGFADVLTALEIPYGSAKSLTFAERLMKSLQKTAEKASFELAKEKGSFPNFEKSEWKKKYKKFRNATVSAIAPTGTISILASCSSGIEPLFAVCFARKVLDGTEMLEVNGQFEAIARREGFYSRDLVLEIAHKGTIKGIEKIPHKWRDIFATAFDIKADDHLKVQSVFQKYCDNSVSKTINLKHDATVEDVKKIFIKAFKMKCKGVTIYRYNSKASQVLSFGAESAGKLIAAGSEFSGGCPASICT